MRAGQGTTGALPLRVLPAAVGDRARLQRAGHGGGDHPADPGRRRCRSTSRSSWSTTAPRTAPTRCSARLADSTVRVLTHAVNRGKGAAIRTGWPARAATCCSSRTPTSSTTPRTGRSCSSPILRGKARVVYGSRFTGERRNMLPLHWIGNRFLSLVTNVLYSSTLSDMETCYKLFDRQVLEGITIESDKFDFEPEITAKVLRRGVRIYEVPISYAGREFERGQEDHLARRLRRALRPSSSTGSRGSSRDLLAARRSAAVPVRTPVGRSRTCLPRRPSLRRHDRRLAGPRSSSTTSAGLDLRAVASPTLGPDGAGPPSWSSSTTAPPTARSPRCRRLAAGPAIWPSCVSSPRGATSATRPRPTVGIAATTAPVVAGVQSRPRRRPGHGAALVARFDADPISRARALDPEPRRQPLSVGPAVPGMVDAVGHALLGIFAPDNRFTRRYRPARRRPGAVRRRRLGVGGAALPRPPQRTDPVGGCDESLLHVRGGRRPLLASAVASAGGSPTRPRPRRPMCRGEPRTAPRTG